MNIKNLEISNDGDISILERVKKNLAKEKCSLLVCYGDEYANINIKKLLKSHFSSKKLLTITTRTLKSNFGFLNFKKNKYSFVEKPVIGQYNIGYMLFDIKNLKFMKNFKSLVKYINKIGSIGEINEYIHRKQHLTINTLEDIYISEKKIKKLNE